jgi:hypothetical protein
MASEAIQTMSKDELVSAVHRYKNYIVSAKQKLQAPMQQGALTLSGWGGGITSGIVRAFVPEVFGVPVDGAIGVALSLFSLMGAGENKLWDATAVFGVGLAAPAFSRGTEKLIKDWMAK